MVDGAALLMAMMWGFRASGEYNGVRGTNLFDGGAPFYEVYETADGGYISIGAIAPESYAELCRLTGLDGEPEHQLDRSTWAAQKERFATLFKRRTRDEWCRLLVGTDVCFEPVLSMDEAPEHPQNRHRQSFVDHGGVVQPAPAPRFSRTPGRIAGLPAAPGEHTDEVLEAWLGLDRGDRERLRNCGAVTGTLRRLSPDRPGYRKATWPQKFAIRKMSWTSSTPS
jgi:alpha-methylacyl-CoA racemase